MALKTLGLLALMAKAGLFLPVASLNAEVSLAGLLADSRNPGRSCEDPQG